MCMKRLKLITDILAAAGMLTAIVTGFVLHNEIHHLHVYHDVLVWTIHEVAGLLMTALVAVHCVQHKAWFKNYGRISMRRKHASTLFLVALGVILVTGLMLMFGSRSHFVSLLHYVLGILATLMMIAHILRRWRLLRGLMG